MTQIDKVLVAAETTTLLLWLVYLSYAMKLLGRLNILLPPARRVRYRFLLSREVREAYLQLFPHDSALRVADRLFRVATVGMIVVLGLSFLTWIID